MEAPSRSFLEVEQQCYSIHAAARRATVRPADCRMVARFVRKLGVLLESLEEENPELSWSEVDHSGWVTHALGCCQGLVQRCGAIGQVEAFLETAHLRLEFKTVAEELRAGLKRLDLDSLRVPDDTQEDLSVLCGQLSRCEFSVEVAAEEAAEQLHTAVLLERAALCHDTQLVRLLKEVLADCGVRKDDRRWLAAEAASLETRAREVHEMQDHIHEAVLLKVAELLRTELLAKLPLRSSNENVAPPSPLPSPFALSCAQPPAFGSPDARQQQQAAAAAAGLLPNAASTSGLAGGCLAERKASSASSSSSLAKRCSFNNSATGPGGGGSAAAGGGGNAALRPAARCQSCCAPPSPEPPTCNEVVLRSVGSACSTADSADSLLQRAAAISAAAAAASTSQHTPSAAAAGPAANVADCSSGGGSQQQQHSCPLVSECESLDADDLQSLVAGLQSGNAVTMQVAATSLLHTVACRDFDFTELDGCRMKVIRPLVNILRYRHPLSLKTAAAGVLRYLARRRDNRQLIADAGGLVLLLKLLRSQSDSARQAAARAISNVCCNIDAVKAEVVKAGAVEQLHDMLASLHPGNREAAALVIANLACNNSEHTSLLVDAGSVPLLVTVLRACSGSDGGGSSSSGGVGDAKFGRSVSLQQLAAAAGVGGGSPGALQAAARALRNLASKSPAAKAAALQHGAAPLLLAVAARGDAEPGCAAAACHALGSLALNSQPLQDSIVAAGGLLTLVGLLSSSDAQLREAATSAVAPLLNSDEARVALLDAGGLPPLVAALQAPAPDGCRAAAAAALRALVGCDLRDVKQRVAVSGALPLLAGMLASDSEAVQKSAAGVLWNLAYKDEANRNAVREAGAVPLLVRLLKSYRAESTRLEAARAISNLSCNNTANQVAIAAAGAINPLVHLLQSGSLASKEAAARALSNLALLDDNQEDISEAGAVEPLLELMRSGPDSCREAAVRAYGNVIVNNCHRAVVSSAPRAIPLIKQLVGDERHKTVQLEAARALGNLACVNSDIQVAISRSGVIPLLIKMLDSGHDATREAAACALWDIAFENDDCRLEIVASNGVPYLVQALLFGCTGTKEAAASTLSELAATSRAAAAACNGGGRGPAAAADGGVVVGGGGGGGAAAGVQQRQPGAARQHDLHLEDSAEAIISSPSHRAMRRGPEASTATPCGAAELAASPMGRRTWDGGHVDAPADQFSPALSTASDGTPRSTPRSTGQQHRLAASSTGGSTVYGGDDGGGAGRACSSASVVDRAALTGDAIRAAIVDAGAMPLLIELACSGEAKLRTVGARALEVLGYSCDSEEALQRKPFPQVSAYAQPVLLASATSV